MTIISSVTKLLPAYSLLLMVIATHAASFDPYVVSSVLAGFVSWFGCQVRECCGPPWYGLNETGLKTELANRLYGQHLVQNLVLRAVKAHVQDEKPKKALVMSFHGWTGGGKNYVSSIIARHLFTKGLSSRNVHVFVATVHFPHEQLITKYKDDLQQWVTGNVSNCPHSLFIFDEMDKMPVGLLDALKPFLDFHPQVNGVDFRKATFILLSNTGGDEISKITYDHWLSGKRREELTYKPFEDAIVKTAYNEAGAGLWHSELIRQHLISLFVPFLPLERRHVVKCAEAELLEVGGDIKDAHTVVDQLSFFPPETGVFSKTGCKRVSQRVRMHLINL